VDTEDTALETLVAAYEEALLALFQTSPFPAMPTDLVTKLNKPHLAISKACKNFDEFKAFERLPDSYAYREETPGYIFVKRGDTYEKEKGVAKKLQSRTVQDVFRLFATDRLPFVGEGEGPMFPSSSFLNPAEESEEDDD
jgi:hypothetical protein